jgi:GNAT superfamily N-acetyltransferase
MSNRYIPYGYKFEAGQPVPHPDESQIVGEIFHRYCAGDSLKVIAEDLTNRPPRTTPEDKYYAGYFRDGRLIGALDLITGFPAPETAFVGFFMLHKDVQGAGLGSALIGDLLAFLKDAGFRAVRLMYVKGNPQSAAFWTKNGFTPTGVEPKQENYTQVVLERTL